MPTMLPLTDLLQPGEPLAHQGVAVWPLFPRRSPLVDYVALEDALPLGFRVTEVDELGAVPELSAVNPLELGVLLYDGEELEGAKQDRILNVTVLVAPRSETRIPVSCVEQGRWRYERRDFAPARQAAYPELRRRKAERLHAEPLARGAAQAEVWEAVEEKQARHATRSRTGAAADVFTARERDLAPLRDGFPLQQGQAGAILALADVLCLDYVSRPSAFAVLYPRLLDGYLLDALERHDASPAGPGRAEAFLDAVAAVAPKRGPSVGLGTDLRLASRNCIGSGLEVDGELVQLSAFTRAGGAAGVRAPILRPTGRR